LEPVKNQKGEPKHESRQAARLQQGLRSRPLDLAVEMAKIPVEPPPELLNELRRCFDEAQLVELAAAIAWENYRARFNRVFGVRPVGFCEGAFCALPER
jgi:alkylhydroperoxidase family enzyme